MHIKSQSIEVTHLMKRRRGSDERAWKGACVERMC